jgi:hypothetical protein
MVFTCGEILAPVNEYDILHPVKTEATKTNSKILQNTKLIFLL